MRTFVADRLTSEEGKITVWITYTAVNCNPHNSFGGRPGKLSKRLLCRVPNPSHISVGLRMNMYKPTENKGINHPCDPRNLGLF